MWLPVEGKLPAQGVRMHPNMDESQPGKGGNLKTELLAS